MRPRRSSIYPHYEQTGDSQLVSMRGLSQIVCDNDELHCSLRFY